MSAIGMSYPRARLIDFSIPYYFDNIRYLLFLYILFGFLVSINVFVHPMEEVCLLYQLSNNLHTLSHHLHTTSHHFHTPFHFQHTLSHHFHSPFHHHLTPSISRTSPSEIIAILSNCAMSLTLQYSV